MWSARPMDTVSRFGRAAEPAWRGTGVLAGWHAQCHAAPPCVDCTVPRVLPASDKAWARYALPFLVFSPPSDSADCATSLMDARPDCQPSERW